MQLSEYSFYISKASFDKATQERRWTAVASDTALDLSHEKMSLEVFKSFIEKAQSGIKVPLAFRSKFWDGGMPYLSVSHYLDLDGKWAAGEVTSLYIDGKQLKAKGVFFDNPVGIASFDAVCKSLYSEQGDGYENKIRISIGFIDYKHSHGDYIFERKDMSDSCPLCAQGEQNKVYLDGQLVHLAMTRIPCNVRTDFDLEEKSMTTKKQDASTIIGEELAEEIDRDHKLVGKSEESLVIKKDTKKEDEEDMPDDEKAKKEKSETVEPEVEKSLEEKYAYGAMSFEEYEAIETAYDDMWKMEMLLNTFTDIAYNIISYSANVRDDMSALVTELKSRLETKSEKMQEKMQETLEMLVQKMDNKVDLVEKTEKHPLDESLLNLKSVFDTVMESEESQGARLQKIQEAFELVGKDIQSKTAPQSEQSSTQEGLPEDAIAKAVEKSLAPFAEQIAVLVERIKQSESAQASTKVERKPLETPQPRSLNVKSLQEPTQQNSSPTPNLRAMLQRTVQEPKTRL